jgi:hypothetical protein
VAATDVRLPGGLPFGGHQRARAGVLDELHLELHVVLRHRARPAPRAAPAL